MTAMRPLARPSLLAVAALVLLRGAATGHTELVDAAPEQDARLDRPPTEVVLVFDDELDPDSSGFVVTDASGAEVGRGQVDLQVADRNEILGDVAIAQPGVYEVRWSVVGRDKHAVEGSHAFTYTVEATTDPTPTPAAAPDTSLSGRPVPSPVVLVGIACLGATVLLLRRRRVLNRNRAR